MVDSQLLLTNLDNNILGRCIKAMNGPQIKASLQIIASQHAEINFPFIIDGRGVVMIIYHRKTKKFVRFEYQISSMEIRIVVIPLEHRINNIFTEYLI